MKRGTGWKATCAAIDRVHKEQVVVELEGQTGRQSGEENQEKSSLQERSFRKGESSARLLNAYYFHTIVNSKNPKPNHPKFQACVFKNSYQASVSIMLNNLKPPTLEFRAAAGFSTTPSTIPNTIIPSSSVLSISFISTSVHILTREAPFDLGMIPSSFESPPFF